VRCACQALLSALQGANKEKKSEIFPKESRRSRSSAARFYTSPTTVARRRRATQRRPSPSPRPKKTTHRTTNRPDSSSHIARLPRGAYYTPRVDWDLLSLQRRLSHLRAALLGPLSAQLEESRPTEARPSSRASPTPSARQSATAVATRTHTSNPVPHPRSSPSSPRKRGLPNGQSQPCDRKFHNTIRTPTRKKAHGSAPSNAIPYGSDNR